MTKITLVITGDAELNRKLRKLGSKEARNIVRKAARVALKPVLQEARALAPVKTGKLRKHIKIRSLTRSRKSFGARVTSGFFKNVNSGDAYYGAFVELGTKERRHRSGKSVGSIAPRRFMKNAADKKRQQALRIYGQEIGRLITELANRG